MSQLSRYTLESRVICPALKKVYSCAESAGYALGISPIKIRLCCEHRIREVWTRYGDSRVFLWYEEYCRSTPKKDWILQDPIEYHLVKRPITELDMIKKKRMNERNYFTKIRFMYLAMRNYLDKNNCWGEEIPIWIIHEVFLSYVREKVMSSFTISIHGVAQHILACEISYKRIFNIELGKVWSERASKKVLSAKFYEVEGINEDTVDKIPISSYRLKARKFSTPVIDLQTGKIYGSIRKASREEHIREEWIEWCCRGDVSSIFKVHDERQLKFRFVRFT